MMLLLCAEAVWIMSFYCSLKKAVTSWKTKTQKNIDDFQKTERVCVCVSRVLQALEMNKVNTKALFRRSQAWQGLKEYSKAMVDIKDWEKFLSCSGSDHIKSRCMWRCSVFGQVKYQLNSPDMFSLFRLIWRKLRKSLQKTKVGNRRHGFHFALTSLQAKIYSRSFPSSHTFAYTVYLFEHFMHIHMHNSNLACKRMKKIYQGLQEHKLFVDPPDWTSWRNWETICCSESLQDDDDLLGFMTLCLVWLLWGFI